MYTLQNNLKELPQVGVTSLHRSVGSAASMRGDNFSMEETWYDIPEWENQYQISSNLRVRSLDRIHKGNKKNRFCKGKILSVAITWNGYHTVKFQELGKTKTMYIHRLVALAMIPNPENKKEVNHKDGNKDNNHPTNLEWATRLENIEHAFKNGLIKTSVGVEQSRTKLTEEQVKYVLSSDKGERVLGRELGMSHTSISSIRLGKSWNHISGIKRNSKFDKRKFKL